MRIMLHHPGEASQESLDGGAVLAAPLHIVAIAREALEGARVGRFDLVFDNVVPEMQVSDTILIL